MIKGSILKSLILIGIITLITSCKEEKKHMEKYKEIISEYEEAWSNQDEEKLLSFFAEDVVFEDLAWQMKSSNKKEFQELLQYTLQMVPNFKMTIIKAYEGENFVVLKWKQSGNMTVSGYGLELDKFEYSSIVTSIIEFDDDNKIISLTDNWNSHVLYIKDN